MFLPIGDEPNPRGTPVVTYALLTINTAVFVLVLLPLTGEPPGDHAAVLEYVRALGSETGLSQIELARRVTSYDLFLFEYGFRPGKPELSDLFVSMFLHGGWMHLLGNMLFLWIYGDNVEHRLGHFAYLLMYLATGVCATLFFALFQLSSQVPLVGASGAISGVLGCYFVWFPQNRVKVLLVLFVFVQVVLIPARWVLGIYLIWDNVVPFVFGARGGVAHGAHIGGFAGGFALAFAMVRAPHWFERVVPGPQRRRPSRQRQPDRGRRGAAVHVMPGGDPVMTVDSLLAIGDVDRAFDAYARLSGVQRSRLDDLQFMRLASLLAENGDSNAALAVLQEFFSMRPQSDANCEAHVLAGRILSRDQPSRARQHFITALELARSPRMAMQARRGLAALGE